MLHYIVMIIIGLTGSIGMGKSVVAQQFKRLGVPVYDSDKIVHSLLNSSTDVILGISDLFTSVVKDGKVNRRLLGDIVFNDIKALSKLENFIHPIINKKKKHFIKICKLRRNKFIILDIPLLFEKNNQQEYDKIIVVSAPKFVQAYRVLSRSRMTPKKFKFILSQQMSDQEKCRRADFLIKSGLGKYNTLCQIKKIKKLIINNN